LRKRGDESTMVNSKDLKTMLEDLMKEDEVMGLDHITESKRGTERIESKLGGKDLRQRIKIEDADELEELKVVKRPIQSSKIYSNATILNLYKELFKQIGLANTVVTDDRLDALNHCIEICEDSDIKDAFTTIYCDLKTLNVDGRCGSQLRAANDKIVDYLKQESNRKVIGLGLSRYKQYLDRKELSKQLNCRYERQSSGARIVYDFDYSVPTTRSLDMDLKVEKVFNDRVAKILRKNFLFTVGDLYKAGKDRLMLRDDIGVRVVDAVKKYFKSCGIKF